MLILSKTPFYFSMPRFSRRFRRAVYARQKRNVERIIRSGSANMSAATQSAVFTYTATKACVAKNIKLDIGAKEDLSSTIQCPYVLVVVREGYNPNLINWPALTDDLYNPTMDVLICGVLTDRGIEDQKSNYIGRKLKAGDRLCLIVSNTSSGSVGIMFETNMSILD